MTQRPDVLIDVCLDTGLVTLLAEFGFNATTAAAMGWRHLKNGELVKIAADSNFKCIFTRDGLFPESAQ